MIAVLLLLATVAFAGDFDFLVPDAAGLMLPMDGGIEATQIETASWNVAEVFDRRAWLDLFEPVTDFGVGASVDITPGGAASVGVGYRDRLFAYAGVHVQLSF